jgi:hypothetical protein
LVPKRNIALSLTLAVLAIVAAMLLHSYAVLVLLVGFLALPFFLNRARRR